MKINTTLDISTYVQTVADIAASYFDAEGNYVPQYGHIYSLCAFYNVCVQPEEIDHLDHPIVEAVDIEQITNNDEIVQAYYDEIYGSASDERDIFDFVNAYEQALDIVDTKKQSLNAIATAIRAGLKAVADSLENFSEKDLTQFAEVAKKLLGENKSALDIAKAYVKENKEKTAKAQEVRDSNVVDFGSAKE